MSVCVCVSVWVYMCVWNPTYFIFLFHLPILLLLLRPLSPLQVIPLESVMKKPRRMPAVLDAACIIVIGVNLPFALYGYFLFGEKTNGTYQHLPVAVNFRPPPHPFFLLLLLLLFRVRV